MPFNQKPQKFNAKINAVTIGSGDKTVTIGGDCTFPFYSFDAESENCPKIGVEISDMGLEGVSEVSKLTMKALLQWLTLLRKLQLWRVLTLLHLFLRAATRTVLTNLSMS